MLTTPLCSGIRPCQSRCQVNPIEPCILKSCIWPDVFTTKPDPDTKSKPDPKILTLSLAQEIKKY
jgi:hypothetical protein